MGNKQSQCYYFSSLWSEDTSRWGLQTQASETQTESGGLPYVRRQRQGSGRATVATQNLQERISDRRMLPRRRTSDIFRESLQEFRCLLICACLGENYPRTERELLRAPQETTSGAPRRTACDHQPIWKTLSLRGASGRGFRSLASVVGRN